MKQTLERIYRVARKGKYEIVAGLAGGAFAYYLNFDLSFVLQNAYICSMLTFSSRKFIEEGNKQQNVKLYSA